MSSGRELRPWITPLEQALPGLVEVNADAQLVKKVRLGNEMVSQDFSSDLLPVFEKGGWVKITSPEEGLVAILRPEVRSMDLRQAGRSRIALRPLRVFHSSKHLA